VRRRSFPQPIEYRDAIIAADHHLAVNQAGAAGQGGHCGGNSRPDYPQPGLSFVMLVVLTLFA
jgi:hypothetical protein